MQTMPPHRHLAAAPTAPVLAVAAASANDPLYCPAWFAAHAGDPSGPGLRAWHPAHVAVRPASNQTPRA